MGKKIIILTFAVFLLVVAGCAADSPEQSIVIAIPTDPDGFHPHQAVAAASGEIAFNIYEGLVKAAPDGDTIPALATEWSISDDGLSYTFTIREGVKFHNGRELTPQDVAYSLNRLRDPQISSKSQDYTGVLSIQARSKTVEITLAAPDAAFLALLTEFGASIYPSEAEQQLATQPVGTGPFALTSWEPNNQLILTKNEQYWNSQLPMAEQVTLKIIPEPSTAVNNLRTGHVDLIPRLEPDYLHQVENESNLKIIDNPMNLVQLLAINNTRAPFDDIRVRQAVNYAVNREQIIQGAAWGRGNAVGSNLSPAMDAWYTDLTGYYPYNQAKARQLLADAGYPDGFEAIIHLPAPYPLHRSAGEIIADQLEQVGIELKIEVIEWGAWLEQIYANRDFALTVIGFTGKLDPHTVLNRYLSTSSRNFGSFSSSEYDDLLMLGLQQTDPAQRQVIYHRLQTILAEEASNVYIMDPSQLAVMNQDIQGWANYPVYVLDLATLRRAK